jgi:hypothetical protein
MLAGRLGLIILFSILSFDNAAAQPAMRDTSTGSAITLPPEKAQPVTIPRLSSRPTIDGKIDEDAWKPARVLKDFYQTQPGDNIAPSQPTELLIGYDSTHLYFAFRAFDDPSKVRATVAKRDAIFEDDTVSVFLDTYNDRRKGYALVFNPYGIQADGIISSSGGEDYSLDIVMESKGALSENGYVVEVAIPFKSLRYEAGKGKLWGFHAFRRIKRFDNEQNSWMPLFRNKSSLLAQAGHITGLEGLSNESTLEVIPTLTLSETGQRVRALPLAAVINNPGTLDPGRFVNKPLRADPGVTVKYGITPTITLDFAANPDFAQVEADAPVVTANQRFPIFFEEKRPFFLEGADIFGTPLQAVHTRTIIDPDFAVKLSGKQGRTSFGVLMASDNAPGDFSDEEKSDPLIFQSIARFVDKNAYIGVLRVKRDVGTESSLGLIATSYNFIEKRNQLGGVDGHFRIDKQTTFTFQALGTTSRQFFFDPDLGQSLYRTGNAFGYFWNYDFTGRNFGYSIEGQGRTRDYRADVGFVRRTDTNYQGSYFRYSIDPRPKATLVGWRTFFGNSFNWDWKGRLQDRESFVDSSVQFTRQTWLNVSGGDFYSRVFEEEFGPRRSATRSGAFFGDDSERSIHGRWVGISISTNPSQKYSGNFFVGHRWNVFDLDFGAGPRFPRVSPAALADPNAALDPGPANTRDISAGFTYQPVSELRLSINYDRNRFRRNDTGRDVFIDNIYSLRGTYQFTRFTFVRVRVDYDSLAASVRGQYLFGWNPNPGTSLYVGYNDDSHINGFNPFTGQHERGWRRNGRTFFIKTSYLIRRSI